MYWRDDAAAVFYKSLKTVSGVFAADGDLVAAVPGKRIKVVGYSLITGGTSLNLILFKSNAVDEKWRVPLQAIAGAVVGANLCTTAPNYIFGTAAGEKLSVDVSQASDVHYSLTYYDSDEV